MSAKPYYLSTLIFLPFSTYIHASNQLYSLICVDQEILSASPTTTVEQLRKKCAKTKDVMISVDKANTTPNVLSTETETAQEPEQKESLLLSRIQRERIAARNRSSLTPHKRNYILPVTYTSNINEEPYIDLVPDNIDGLSLENVEAKFQISLKTLLLDNIFINNDTLHFSFTGVSYWQIYNKDISSPFRETNYEPEIFWSAPISWRPFDVDATALVLGFNHQSNGQTGTLSRSWNRLYANFIWESENFVYSFKPWYRVPEDAKETPDDPEGDDNPDIEKYLGNFEFTTVYRRGDYEFTTMFRNNLRSENRGAFQIDWTFPLLKNVRGYVQYFNGYGENLIDYNARTQRIGFGFLLSDLL